jgi:hypothetical protein
VHVAAPQGTEHAARLAALPSVLTGTFACGRHDRALSDEVATVTAYLGWARLRDAAEHTDASASELVELCAEVQEKLIRYVCMQSSWPLCSAAAACLLGVAFVKELAYSAWLTHRCVLDSVWQGVSKHQMAQVAQVCEHARIR